jgi:predicted ester cyclase
MPTFDVEAFLRESLDHVWNGRLPGRLYECMAAAVAIHGPSGQELLGREEAVAEVVAWLAVFPDMRLTIEEVVWSGDERRGILASVRQTRASAFSPAAGQPATCAGIAHYLICDGLIREVWQEWDELGLAEQLGLDRSQTLARLAAERRPAGAAPPFGQGEIRRSAGQLPPAALPAGRSPQCAAAELVLSGLHDIWNRRLVGRVDEVCAGELVWQVGCGQPSGRDDLAAHVLARLAALPDLSLHVDQLVCQEEPHGGIARLSLAWTLLGTHTGPGVYGSPTGRRIRLSGLSQLHVMGGRIVAQWDVCGELALAAQLAGPPESHHTKSDSRE